jgi:uncharacterized RDD family membrane protein YckC
MTEQQYLSSEVDHGVDQSNTDGWRKEIHSRVAGYRTRRARRIEGAFSMRFPFPPTDPPPASSAPPVQPASSEQDISLPSATKESEPSSTIVADADPLGLTLESVSVMAETSAEVAPTQPREADREQPARSRPRPKRKVIAFPRQAGASEPVQRLADPISAAEQPRILDVPEELEAFPTTPFLDGLPLEPVQQAPTAPSEHIELPFRAVGISQRIYAAFVDCLLVAAAVAVFGLIVFKMLPELVSTKPVVLTAALVPVLFWAIYQYLFLVHGGRTAGMQVAGIDLRTFKGSPPSLRYRRNRVLGLYLSTASLVMGLLWAFVDVDALCWHDRISGTYLTKRKQ